MCPACLEALALVIVGVSSTGGVAALVASKLRGDPKENAVVADLLRSANQEEGHVRSNPRASEFDVEAV